MKTHQPGFWVALALSILLAALCGSVATLAIFSPPEINPASLTAFAFALSIGSGLAAGIAAAIAHESRSL